MATAVRTQDADMKKLLKEAKEHEAFIASIKAEVSREVNNLDNPVPLFQQLHSAH